MTAKRRLSSDVGHVKLMLSVTVTTTECTVTADHTMQLSCNIEGLPAVPVWAAAALVCRSKTRVV